MFIFILPATIGIAFVVFWFACDAIAAKLRERDDRNFEAGFDHAIEGLDDDDSCGCVGCVLRFDEARWN